MVLLPGMAMTTGIRDTLEGDFMSGSARMIEAFVIAASIAVGIGVGPVSYTHLDVYKRQYPFKADATATAHAPVPQASVSPEPRSHTLISTVFPVSYTHLDVYKRQASSSPNCSDVISLIPHDLPGKTSRHTQKRTSVFLFCRPCFDSP